MTEEVSLMNRTNELFQEQLTILNVGAPNFREDLKLQGQQVTQIKWQPPMDLSLIHI